MQGEVQEESCSESGLDSSSSREEEAVEEREAEEDARLLEAEEVEEVKEVVLGDKGEAQKTRQFVFSQRSHAAQQDKRCALPCPALPSPALLVVLPTL